MTRTNPRDELPSLRVRLHDLGWSVATAVLSTLLAAGFTYMAGELSGVNARIFPVTCSDFATEEEAQDYVDMNPDARERLDRDGDGVPCEK